jgi:Holliday junction resolvasome RuvABC endonuclease subunit
VIIIGVDPGLACCGAAVVGDGDCWGIETWKHGPREGTAEERGAAYVQDLFNLLVDPLTPREITLAVESQFTAPHGTAGQWGDVQNVTLIRGMLCGAAAAWGWRVVSVTPAEGKLALTGRGNSDKRAMRKMAQLRFALPKLPSEHIADALGVALAAQRKLRELQP